METVTSQKYALDNKVSEFPDFDAPYVETVSMEDVKANAWEMGNVETYQSPVASTDYTGLEKIDSRLVDREWRLNNLYTVINEEGEKIRFKMRAAQRKLLHEMHYKNIILKARQLGFTTFICIFLLDYALFNRNKHIGIVAHTQTDASVIFRKVKVSWEGFPQEIKDFIGLDTVGDSKVEYEFTNGSIMRISTSLRSGTYQAVLVTEFGKICAHFPEKAEEIITGTLPAVPAKGLVFIESTAEGEEGRFYDMVQEAMDLKDQGTALTVKDYKFHFYAWFDNPADVIEGVVLPITAEVEEYLAKVEREQRVVFSQAQKNWYFTERKMQKDKMKQEHPASPDEAFLSSGNKLFSVEALEAQAMNVIDPIYTDGAFKIYKKFVKGNVYMLGADVSLGIKRDSSTIVVIDLMTGETVLTYRSSTVDPVTFAYDIKKAALDYGGCIAAPEANSTGIGTCIVLNQIYPNVFTQVRDGMLEVQSSSKLGWLTTPGSKPKMMYELSEAFESGDIKILDKGLLAEARKFNKEDSLQASSATTTRHFDLLIASAIAWQMKIYASKGMAEPAEVARVEGNRQRALSNTKGKFR